MSKLYWAVFIVFVVSGIWHGANWTFLIWGALHGSYMAIGLMTQNIRKKISSYIGLTKLPKFHIALQIITTFLLVNLGWIFFRANSLSDAYYIVTHIFQNISFDLSGLGLAALDIRIDDLYLGFIFIGFMEFVHLIQEQVRMREFLSNKPLLLRWSLYLIILFSILIFGVFEKIQFIYFQF